MENESAVLMSILADPLTRILSVSVYRSSVRLRVDG